MHKPLHRNDNYREQLCAVTSPGDHGRRVRSALTEIADARSEADRFARRNWEEEPR